MSQFEDKFMEIQIDMISLPYGTFYLFPYQSSRNRTV